MAHAPRRSLLVVPILVAACLALSAGSASASTVSADSSAVWYTAAPGETNNLNIHMDWWDTFKFYVDDPGAVISVGPHCHSIDIHHAYCDGLNMRNMYIDAGDGNDTVHATNEARIHGGPGDEPTVATETLFLGTLVGDADIWGDDGNDQIWGNNGEDVIDGGNGA